DRRFGRATEIERPDVEGPELRLPSVEEDSPSIPRDGEALVDPGDADGRELASGPVEPREALPGLPGLVDDGPGPRRRERSGEVRDQISHVLGDRHAVARGAAPRL